MAERLGSFGGLLVLALVVGALLVGYAASRREVCEVGAFSTSCETEVEVVVLVVVAVSYLIAGLVIIYPLYFGLAALLRAQAELLGNARGDRPPAE